MIIILIALIGVALGSFVNALVWRVYMTDQLAKSAVKKKKAQFSIAKGRSMCPSCQHELKPRDLVPLVSWIFLRGKCRYCNKPIPVSYPLIEAATAIVLVASYIVWPYALNTVSEWSVFAIWALVVCVGVAVVVYDLKWMIIPNKLVYSFNLFSFLFLILLALSMNNQELFLSGILGSLLFSGFFYVLYQISQGKWIGGGDVRLAVGLGLLLGWQKSIVSLTLAAYLGTFVIIVLIVIKKYHRKMKLPFGPFLLTATYLTVLFGQHAIDWYLRMSGL